MNRFVQSGESAVPATASTYGALIGIVDLVDIVPLSVALESNRWAWGPYCWRVANPRGFLKPIPAKGKLKLYTLDANMSAVVRDAVESSRFVRPGPDASAWIKRIAQLDTAVERYAGLFDSYMALGDVPSLMRLAANAIEERGDSDAFVYRAIAMSFNDDNSAGKCPEFRV
ncbi:MAG: hypothetical protein IPI73_18845 [Betaproteobacteria bacterium]|nr:hypothetical protein [Betaproteobacteria bacterium]